MAEKEKEDGATGGAAGAADTSGATDDNADDNADKAIEPELLEPDNSTGQTGAISQYVPPPQSFMPLPPQYAELFQGKVVINPNGKKGLAILAQTEEEFTIDQMKHLVKYLLEVEDTGPWALADTLNAAQVLYGERASQFEDAAAESEGRYTATTIEQICFTGANVAPEVRQDKPSIWFHRKVAKFQERDQIKLLKECLKAPAAAAEKLASVGVKKGQKMTLKQFELWCKLHDKGPAATLEDLQPKKKEGEAAPKEVAPKEEGGALFVFRFRAREAREPLDIYLQEEKEAHDKAIKAHVDASFAKTVEEERQAEAAKEQRAKERTKITAALKGMPEAEHALYLGQFDGGATFEAVKAAIGSRKAAIKKEQAKKAPKKKAAKKGSSKKGGSKKKAKAAGGADTTELPTSPAHPKPKDTKKTGGRKKVDKDQFRGSTGGGNKEDSNKETAPPADQPTPASTEGGADTEAPAGT